jgi:hypothetical protein
MGEKPAREVSPHGFIFRGLVVPILMIFQAEFHPLHIRVPSINGTGDRLKGRHRDQKGVTKGTLRSGATEFPLLVLDLALP